MTEAPNTDTFARPRVAAGALFTDAAGRVMLVRPTYKDHWDIAGGYVQPGESPRAACIREICEELTMVVDIGPLLVVDWAPAPDEGDKILFIFDGGTLTDQHTALIHFGDGELSEWQFTQREDLEQFVPARLARRIDTAVIARAHGTAYAEHGNQI